MRCAICDRVIEAGSLGAQRPTREEQLERDNAELQDQVRHLLDRIVELERGGERRPAWRRRLRVAAGDQALLVLALAGWGCMIWGFLVAAHALLGWLR